MIASFIFLIGLCFGSFATLVSWRLPRGEAICATRSQCPKCKTNLGVLDLFPLLSWLLSKGKCRHCGEKVHWRYPAIELLCAASFLLVYSIYGLSVDLVIIALLAAALITMLVIDFEHYIIPDSLQIFFLGLGIAWQLYHGAIILNIAIAGLVGLAIGAALKYGFLLLRNKDGLGMGDVKFLGVAGVWLGIAPIPVLMFLSGIIGIFTALIWRVLGHGERFPFGPALGITMFLLIIYPDMANIFEYLAGYAVNAG